MGCVTPGLFRSICSGELLLADRGGFIRVERFDKSRHKRPLAHTPAEPAQRMTVTAVCCEPRYIDITNHETCPHSSVYNIPRSNHPP